MALESVTPQMMVRVEAGTLRKENGFILLQEGGIFASKSQEAAPVPGCILESPLKLEAKVVAGLSEGGVFFTLIYLGHMK